MELTRSTRGSWPTGRTRLAGIIGDPVRHSLSPALHNAAFSALGLDWAYVAFPVPPGRVRDALAGALALGIDGLSVTMPHKTAVAEAIDRCSPTAEALNAVNTVVRRGGELFGESTDGPGFIDAIRAEPGIDPAGCRCVVLGAGGAARAVILALAEAGAAEVLVVNRTADRGRAAAALAGSVGRLGALDLVEGMDLVVNATPVGMAVGMAVGDSGSAPDPAGADTSQALPSIAADRLAPGQVFVDLVYHPATTPLMEAASRAGATAVNGLGMLVHQAALAFRLWTGVDPPIDVMRAVAAESLEGRVHR